MLPSDLDAFLSASTMAAISSRVMRFHGVAPIVGQAQTFRRSL
jgi:hypothetical protein